MDNKAICEKCGLPKELCVCQVIEREAQKIKVYKITRKFNKPVTIIEGIDKNSAKSVLKELKTKLACGGSFKEGKIELQGNHTPKVKEILSRLGFEKNQIETV